MKAPHEPDWRARVEHDRAARSRRRFAVTIVLVPLAVAGVSTCVWWASRPTEVQNDTGATVVIHTCSGATYPIRPGASVTVEGVLGGQRCDGVGTASDRSDSSCHLGEPVRGSVRVSELLHRQICVIDDEL